MRCTPCQSAACHRSLQFVPCLFFRESSNNLDLQSGWCQRGQILRHALTNPSEHGGADQQHDVRVRVLRTFDEQRKQHHRKNNPRISLRMWNSAPGRLKRTPPTKMFPSGSSQVFSVSELSAVLFILLSHKNHVTQLFLHIVYTLTFCCGSEGVPSLREDLHQLLCDDLPSPDGGWRAAKRNLRRWELCETQRHLSASRFS